MIINKRVHDHFIVNSYCDPSHIYKVDLPRWVLLFWWWGHPYSQVNFSPFSKLFSSPCCQSEYTQALLSLTKLRRQLLARAKRLTHFSYKRSLKLPRLWGGVALLPATTFLPIKRAERCYSSSAIGRDRVIIHTNKHWTIICLLLS